jgi:hypothetical protein
MLKPMNLQIFFLILASVLLLTSILLAIYGNLKRDIMPYIPGGLVIAFIGILATFVVVSNYSQVVEVKGDFKRQIEELASEFEQSTSAAMKTMNDRITIAQSEILGSFLMKVSESIASGNTYEIHLTLSIQTISAFSMLLTAPKELLSKEGIDAYQNDIDKCFNVLDDLLNNIEKKNIKIDTNKLNVEICLDLLEKVNDRRKYRVCKFLLDLKDGEAKKK